MNPRYLIYVIVVMWAVLMVMAGEGGEGGGNRKQGRRRGRGRKGGKRGGRGRGQQEVEAAGTDPSDCPAPLWSPITSGAESAISRVKGRRRKGRGRGGKKGRRERAGFPSIGLPDLDLSDLGLPSLGDVTDAVKDKLEGVGDAVKDKFEEGVAGVKETVTAVVRRIVSAEERLSQAAREYIGPRPWQLNQGICPRVLCEGLTTFLGVTPPGASQDPSRPHGGGGNHKMNFSFFEGDIVLDEGMERRMAAGRRRTSRSVVRPISRLWKYGIVPYIIDQTIDGPREGLIREAFDEIQRTTCIKFKPKTDSDVNYLQYTYSQGCWSVVGMKGEGVQYISIGDGCDRVGTIIHETSHALGFWHEQSRLDRDRYVEVKERNIPDVYVDQFGKRSGQESTSRGYAYDYVSIMHYGNKYFTENGRPTLKVKGVGVKLDLHIGQRKHLSNVDIAQLRAMYYCNEKQANKEACKKGWIKHLRMCYRFYSTEKKHFSGAHRKCEKQGARLLKVSSRAEDDFLKKYLHNHYPNHTSWRTGGRLEKGKFVWVGRVGGASEGMNYTAWAPRNPGHQKSLVLEKFNGTPPRFVWKGDATTAKYNFICETHLNVDCIHSRFPDARDYRGFKSYTTSGITCQSWSSQYPHRHSYLTGDVATDTMNGLGDHNYCRNPGGRRLRPWCFVPLKNTKWQYCDVEVCQE